MKALPPGALRPTIDLTAIGSDGGGAGEVSSAVHERALRSLRMGVAIDAPCFHVFVVGAPGTGKQSAARTIIEEHRDGAAPPPDYCYVQNFGDPDRPTLLTLQTGRARAFAAGVSEAVDLLRRELPRVFDDSGARQWRDRLVREFEESQRKAYAAVEEAAKAAGLALDRVVLGTIARPDLRVRVGDELLSLDDARGHLSGAKERAAEQAFLDLGGRLDEAMRGVRREARSVDQRLIDLEGRDCARVSSGLIEDLKAEFKGDEVIAWLDTLQARIHRRLEMFLGAPEGPDPVEGSEDPPADAVADLAWSRSGDDAFREFRVNVVLDNQGVERRPVIVEKHPTWPNLFGSIDRGTEDPTHLPPDFMGIRGGSLLRANRGFLLMDAEDAFGEPGVWRNLRRTLKNSILQIEAPQDPGFMASSLKPTPIPIDVKVVVTGDYDVYYELYEGDQAFADTFKVKAEFDSEISIADGAVERYANQALTICEREGLPPCEAPAVAALVLAGMREVERRDRVTADLSLVADWIREAAFVARRRGSDRITEEHVGTALDARNHRHDLVRRLALEEITSGVVVIETEGERVGQINALTYFDYGDHRHALPARLTGVVGAGRSGVVSVEREARLSGAIHAKSVLVVMGLLLDRFGQDRALALAASTVFEQSHDLLDGDSASSAETYALLSALGGIPIRQGLAVTGAVTQKGEVLAVGGINEKIEGFFDVCASRGLSGAQGVVLPAGNLENLVLARRVVEAVVAGDFNLWAVDSVDAGLEVVTGLKADDVHAKVAHRLGELADAAAVDSARPAGSLA